MGALLTRLSRRATLAHIRHLTPVPPGSVAGVAGQVRAQVCREFGMLAPPIWLHAASPAALAASWLMLRESLVATGRLDRAAKEAIAAAVSVGNACPYCVDVHGTALHGLAAGTDSEAIAADRLDAVADPGLRTLAAWARHAARRHPDHPPAGRDGAGQDSAGRTGGDSAGHGGTGRDSAGHDSAGRESAGGDGTAAYRPEEAAEAIGVLVVFHYLNRMVSVFLADSPFPPSLSAPARRRVQRLAGRLLRRVNSARREPGAALDLLPAAPLPADLAWAAGTPSIAGAFARAAAAVDAAAERSVPASVRALVDARLAGWNGRPPGISRGWLATATADLPAADRPAGRLALLTALAAYQVDDTLIADFRQAEPGDAALVELTAWASLAAARQVGSWLTTPAPATTG